jgi:hypothetical protein
VHGNNNTKKKNIMKPIRLQEAKCLLIIGKITRYLINNHFTIFRILKNKGKLDKWTSTYAKSFKPQIFVNESTHEGTHVGCFLVFVVTQMGKLILKHFYNAICSSYGQHLFTRISYP